MELNVVDRCCLIVDTRDERIVPVIDFSIIFDSDPRDVLKYGPNGLHLAEHVLWNLISMKYRFLNSNASTYPTGEMWVYGSAYRTDYTKALNSFFDGLTQLAECKLGTELRKIYRTEQRRLTAETSCISDYSHEDGWHEDSTMFVYNADMARGEFPHSYVWQILLKEAKLAGIYIQSGVKLTGEELALFKKRAEAFTKAWQARSPPKSHTFPMFYAPPLSYLTGDAKHADDVLLSLESILNPIERELISYTFNIYVNDFIFKCKIPRELYDKLTNKSKRVKALERFRTQAGLSAAKIYFRHRFPITICGTGDMPKEEWVRDMMTLTPRKLAKKYYQGAEENFLKLLDATALRTTSH